MDTTPQTQDNTPPPLSTPTISWQTQEFEQKDRHPDWVWYVGLVFAIAATISFFYGNIFFGIFLIVAGTVMILYSLRKPLALSVSITEEHIAINESAIAFDRIVRFWLDETGKPDKLLLRVKGSFVPIISLPLEGVRADEIRKALTPHAKEEFIRSSLSEKLFDQIGF